MKVANIFSGEEESRPELKTVYTVQHFSKLRNPTDPGYLAYFPYFEKRTLK
jgi:hypothetical protein